MWQVRELVPHKRIMQLLDSVEGHGTNWVETSLRISEDNLFFEAGVGIPAWVGLEYMAQTIAVYAGIIGRHAGEKPRLGLLLGTRRYNSYIDHFPLGAKLMIKAVEEWRDDQMGVFHCEIKTESTSVNDCLGNGCLAKARLTVFQPANLENFLDEMSK